MLLCWRKLKQTMGATSVLLALFFHFGWCCGCSFPDYMYGTLESWRILSTEPNLPLHHDHRKVSFWHDTIRVEYMMGQQSLFSYTIKCKSIASNETYVVQKDMQGYSAQFTCLQFVPRDINVVQWRMSSWQHYQGDVTCEEDDLQLDEAPLVYYYLRSDYWTERRNKGRDYMPCPLEGGYIMSWKDKTGRFPCGDVLTTMKLENECSPGEGLIFNGLGPPNGCALPHEKLKEKYFCLGSWQEEDDTFLLLHSTQSDLEMPCARYETGHSEHLDIHFFMDGVCDQTPAKVRSKDYITIHLEKHRVPNICVDETPLCRHLKPSQCDAVVTKVCRGTCRACPQDHQEQWSHFVLPQTYQDDWIKFTDFIGRESVLIRGREFTIPSLGTFTSFGESMCMNGSYKRKMHGLEGYEVTEYVLLSFRDNGCSPRVSSLMLKPRSEIVASFRLSYPSPAKVYVDESQYADGSVRKKLGYWGYMCLFADYKEEPEPVGNIFRPYPWSWYNMVRFDPRPGATATCEIPIVGQKFNMTFGPHALRHAGQECTGYTRTEPYTKVAKVDVTLEGCYAENGTFYELLKTERYVFPCVAQFGDYNQVYKNGSRFILVDTILSRDLTDEQYICWIFTFDPDVVYWYPISQCDRLGTRLKRSIKDTPPLAKFNFEPMSYVLISGSTRLGFTHSHPALLLCTLLLLLRAFSL